MTAFASKRVYDVWNQLIQDEELYQAMLDGSHARLAGRNLDAEAVAILDQLRAEPGTKWNIENLRFRSSDECAATLVSYMPRMMALLTRGDRDWLQDLCFEYLAFHHWRALGHMRLAECERFAGYTRTRIMKRRVAPPHLDDTITFELAVVRLIRSTATIAADAWPARRRWADAELPALRPRRSPVQVVIELAVDLRPWIESGDPKRGEVGPGPIQLLVDIPSLDETHRSRPCRMARGSCSSGVTARARSTSSGMSSRTRWACPRRRSVA